MDDIGREHKVLGQQLKIWSDRYGCILENKGGAMPSQHINFVVTSQYSIEDIFWEDKATLEALQRRFKVIHMPKPNHATITRRVIAAAGSFITPERVIPPGGQGV